MTAPQAARFTVRNTQQTDVALTCMDALGGVRAAFTGGTLSEEQMAQVRFELLAKAGSVMAGLTRPSRKEKRSRK